jgi:hypothetical protein
MRSEKLATHLRMLLYQDKDIQLVQTKKSVILSREKIPDEQQHDLRSLKIPTPDQVKEFLKRQTALRKQKNFKVSPETQSLFEELKKNFPVSYQNDHILVMDQVLISKDLKDFKLLKGTQSTLERVRKITLLSKEKLGIH